MLVRRAQRRVYHHGSVSRMTAQYLAHSRALSGSKMSRDWASLLVPRSISSHPHLLNLNKLNLEHLPHYLNRVSRSAVVIWHRRFTPLQHLAPTFKLDHADMVFRLVSPAPRRVPGRCIQRPAQQAGGVTEPIRAIARVAVQTRRLGMLRRGRRGFTEFHHNPLYRSRRATTRSTTLRA